MSTLVLTLTNAGRAALVNPGNTGTNAVTIAKTGVTAHAFTADPDLTILPGEIKRINTISRAAVADDTVHISICDDDNSSYSLRGFGLYLDDGTLFATYSQTAVLLEKSAQSMLLLSVDIKLMQAAAAEISFGNADFNNPPATTTVKGVVELATQTEAHQGSDSTRAMTPATLNGVLNARLGSNAPSAFAKTLIGKNDAGGMRSHLGLKTAALKDEGAGNGLDADKLDGQHGSWYQDWNNLTGTPATATRWPKWGEVTEKPTTFTPSSHTHSLADVTGLQNALNEKASKDGQAYTGLHHFTGSHVAWGQPPEQTLRVELGPDTFATWLVTGATGNNFKGGVQMSGSGDLLRLYANGHYAQLHGKTWSVPIIYASEKINITTSSDMHAWVDFKAGSSRTTAVGTNPSGQNGFFDLSANRWQMYFHTNDDVVFRGEVTALNGFTGFEGYKAQNGWMKRQDGIIEQWGAYLMPTTSEVTRYVTFPLTFPNGCWNVTVSDINPSAGNKTHLDMFSQVNQGSLTATGFSVFIQASGDNNKNWTGMYWRAIGH